MYISRLAPRLFAPTISTLNISSSPLTTSIIPILPNNLAKKTLTDSFRDYLYSSIKLIKYSYDYISNNSI